MKAEMGPLRQGGASDEIEAAEAWLALPGTNELRIAGLCPS